MKRNILSILFSIGLLVVVAYFGQLALSADPARNWVPRLIGFLALVYVFCKTVNNAIGDLLETRDRAA